MEITEILDVTQIEPILKHSTIFNKIDNLKQGESLVIHNDHDPKPLHYQLMGERGDAFAWEYLENGPEWWKVKITKKGNETDELTIGKIVAANYKKIEVFKKHNIDFCCGGDKTLKQVCSETGISLSQLETELMQIDNKKVSPSFDYNNWDIDFLADYIVNTHHRYVKDNIDLINELALKVANVHGNSHPEVEEVARLFSNIVNVFPDHLNKEENSLFPYIKKLVQIKKGSQNVSELLSVTVENPIDVMKKEHDEAGNIFKEMRRVSNNFLLPADACNSYTYLYQKLNEFEEDLHQHVHLENNILFPKAIQIEKELKSS